MFWGTNRIPINRINICSSAVDRNADQIISKYLLFQGLEEKEVKKQPLLYCHFANMCGDASYAPVTDWCTLRNILTDALESYNELNPAMNLVLFEDAMQHV